METSNIRPIAILASYLSLALLLTLSIIRSIISRHTQNPSPKSKFPSRRNETYLFSALAAVSLATTWFYMFSFFAKSFQDWEDRQPFYSGMMIHQDLGGWLRDTALFKQAWAIAIGTKTRFWWTQQIFSFTTLLSFFLGVESHRHKIPSTWKFMLLGQIVAISFATNLFFLAVLVSSTGTPFSNKPITISKSEADSRSVASSKPGTESEPVDGDGLTSFFCLQFLILPGLGSAAVLPTVLGSSSFMSVLLIPHLLLFVPPLLSDLSRKLGWARGVISAIGREREKLFTTIIVASVVSQGVTTYAAAGQASGWSGITKALYEHPAVSSVGWDVICCWISWGMWVGFGPESLEDQGRDRA